MPTNLERRGNTWHAVLMIPKDARAKLGKFKFSQTLDTTDKRRAEVLKIPLIALWRATIRRGRGESDALKSEAMQLRALLLKLSEDGDLDQKEVLESYVTDRAEELEAKSGFTTAKRYADIVLNQGTPSDAHFDAWHAQQSHLAPKTRDQMGKDVSVMVKRFPILQEVTPQSVASWMGELEAAGHSGSSRARIASFCRSYWRYLQSPAVSAVPMVHPFAGLKIKKKRKGGDDDERAPFEPADVVKLWKEARALEDETLADLIMIGAHTGARIEEICMVKLEHVTAQHSFKIAKSKTAAGIREVPIHSCIRPLVQRLKRASTDGYLVSGLTRNKYGDRSNAIGKRFGRLKTAHGFGKGHVFHSLRATLVTMLENAGVSENLAADIVGHDKPRITYGLYSGGASLNVKAEAIERVRYPIGKATIA